MANRKSSRAKVKYGAKNCTVNFSDVGTARCSRAVSLRYPSTCYSSTARFTRKMQCFGLDKMAVAMPCVGLRIAKDTLTCLTTLILHQHNQPSYSFSFHIFTANYRPKLKLRRTRKKVTTQC